MTKKSNALYGLYKREDLLKILEISEESYSKAMKSPYHSYYKIVNGKSRLIEEPNPELKAPLEKLLQLFQETIPIPDFCYGLGKGKSTIENARAHIKRRESINFDISHYYPNTKSVYVKEFFKNKLKITGEALDALVAMTTCNSHLSTGASTSPILAFLAHQCVFNRIYKKMSKEGLIMTLYFDDISISADKHIGKWVYDFCKKALKQHGLWIKKSKIKRFGYKGAWVTGIHISQSGKLSVPHKLHYKVVKLLKSKPLEQMSDDELLKILGNIAYLKQVQPKSFVVTKNNIRKIIKDRRNQK